MENLRWLYLSGNEIGKIEGLENLGELYLSSNKIGTIQRHSYYALRDRKVKVHGVLIQTNLQ